jgi:hypothetical protein
MRQPQNAKRGRGRGRRGNGSGNHNHVPNRNTSYESNGPDVKLRGNAQQLHEKYMALAHDAATAGERITAEAYTQFADHYFRLHQAAVGASEQRRQQEHSQNGVAAADEASRDAADDDSGRNGAGDASAGEQPATPVKRQRAPRKAAKGAGNGANEPATEDSDVAATPMSPAQLAEAVQDDQDGKIAS